MQITSTPLDFAIESHFASKASLSAFIEEQKVSPSVPFKVEYLHCLQGLQENNVKAAINAIVYFICSILRYKYRIKFYEITNLK